MREEDDRASSTSLLVLRGRRKKKRRGGGRGGGQSRQRGEKKDRSKGGKRAVSRFVDRKEETEIDRRGLFLTVEIVLPDPNFPSGFETNSLSFEPLPRNRDILPILLFLSL